MKIFTVYVKSDEDIIESAKYIQEGFSYKAFFFHIFWLGYHKLWFPAIATILVFTLIGQLESMALISHAQNFLMTLAVILYIGFTGRDFIRVNLEKNGYHLEDLVVASDIDDAEHKFITSIFSDIQTDIESASNEQKSEAEEAHAIR